MFCYMPYRHRKSHILATTSGGVSKRYSIFNIPCVSTNGDWYYRLRLHFFSLSWIKNKSNQESIWVDKIANFTCAYRIHTEYLLSVISIYLNAIFCLTFSSLLVRRGALWTTTSPVEHSKNYFHRVNHYGHSRTTLHQQGTSAYIIYVSGKVTLRRVQFIQHLLHTP